jgi:hypothetical protein
LAISEVSMFAPAMAALPWTVAALLFVQPDSCLTL